MWQLCSEGRQLDEGGLGGHVADQRVLRERAAAESADRGIEASAAGTVRGCDFRGGLVRTSVKMDAELDLLSACEHGADHLIDGCGVARPTVSASEMVWMPSRRADRRRRRLLRRPGVAIRVAEGHRDVGDEIESGLVGERADGFERVDGFLRGLVLVALRKPGEME